MNGVKKEEGPKEEPWEERIERVIDERDTVYTQEIWTGMGFSGEPPKFLPDDEAPPVDHALIEAWHRRELGIDDRFYVSDMVGKYRSWNKVSAKIEFSEAREIMARIRRKNAEGQ